MHKTLKSLILLTLSLATVHGALAQDTEIDEVVVWGTEVRSSSIDMGEEDIAIRQADHLSDLLRTIPGVDVGGAHSLNQRITIRSMDDKDLVISIDGAVQNSYMYHHMGNLQIHADILRSVEIDVGNNSVVNGGLGGGARFKTKAARDLLAADEQFGLRVQGTVADNASDSYSLTAFGQLTDSLDFLAYFNDVNRDNYEVGGGSILDENGGEIPGTDGEVRGLEGELTDSLLKFGWDIAGNQRLTLGYEAYNDEGDYSYRPDMGLATDMAIADSLNVPLVYPTEFTRDTVTLNYTLNYGNGSTLEATAYDNTSTLWRDETGLVNWRPPAATVNEGEAQNIGFGVLNRNSIATGSVEHNITAGADWRDYETRYDTDGATQSSESMTDSAVYIEDAIGFGDSFTLTPGVRYEIFDLDSVTVDDSFNDTTFALAAEYRFAENWALEGSATEIFKSPEIGEVFTGAGLYDTPNPDIKAETGLNSEVVLNYQADMFAAGVTLFQTDIDNYIYDYTPAGKDNVGDMTIDGYEVFGQMTIDNFTALLSYSDAESDLAAFDQYASLDGARLDRQQGDTVSLNLDYVFPRFNIAIHWDSLFVGDLDAGPDLDGATLDNAKDGYDVHNLSAQWTPAGSLRGLQITLGIDNIFDEFYASQSSRTGVSFHPLFQELYLFDYEPGRNIKATVSYQF